MTREELEAARPDLFKKPEDDSSLRESTKLTGGDKDGLEVFCFSELDDFLVQRPDGCVSGWIGQGDYPSEENRNARIDVP